MAQSRRSSKVRRAGQIRSRGDHKWLVSVFLGRDASGKRLYQARTVHGTKADAERFLREQLRRRDRGQLQAGRVSLDAFLEDWLQRGREQWGPRTHEDREALLKRHVRPVLGSRWLDSLTSLDLQRLYDRLKEEGASPDRLRRVHSIVRAALRTALRRRLIAIDPTPGVELPRVARREMQALGPAEAARFLEAARKLPLGLLFETMLATGMRPGEVLGLRWRDSDLEVGLLSVRRVLVRLKGGGWSFQPPKTRRSARAIPVPAELAERLRAHRAEQAQRRLKLGTAWADHDPVFPGQLGQPLDWHNVSQRPFKAICRAAGLTNGLLPYDLRHSTATILLGQGVPAKVVAERLGHSTTTLTLDTYSHVLEEMQRGATAKLGSVLYGSRLSE